VIGCKLLLVALEGELQLWYRHHAGIVHENMERPEPGCRERADRHGVGQVEPGDLNNVVSRGHQDVARGNTSRFDVAYANRDFGAGVCQSPNCLHAYTRGAAGHDRALARQIDVGQNLLRCRVAVKGLVTRFVIRRSVSESDSSM